MKKVILLGAAAVALVGSLSFGASSMAATLFSDPGGPYSEKLHNNHAPSGTTVTLKSKPTGDLVDLTSDAVLNPSGAGDGFSHVSGPFTNVTIDPQDPLLGFTKIGFTLHPVDEFEGSDLFDYSFKVDLTFFGGGAQTLTSVLFPSFKKFDIWSDVTDTGAIATVKIYALSGFTGGKKDPAVLREGLVFDDIRHISYERLVAPCSGPGCGGGGGGGGPIPEPAAWAMMILGFGAAGTMLRRRRAALA